MEQQTKQALENIRAILEAAGATLDNVLKVTVIITNPEHFARINAVYEAYFEEPYPTRATFVAALVISEMLVEIDAIARVSHA